jgi:exportin-5
MSVLRIDAHFTVVEAALKGYVKWRAKIDLQSSDNVSRPNTICMWTIWLADDFAMKNQQKSRMESDFEAWCGRLLERQVQVESNLRLGSKQHDGRS